MPEPIPPPSIAANTTHNIAALPAGSQRLDDYLKARTERDPPWRRIFNDDTDWLAIAENVELRRYPDNGWFVMWWDGEQWIRLGDIEPTRRPRMFQGYCYILPEGA